MLAAEALIMFRSAAQEQVQSGVLHLLRLGTLGLSSLSRDEDKRASADASESCLRDMR
jgi:hypothetical protein